MRLIETLRPEKSKMALDFYSQFFLRSLGLRESPLLRFMANVIYVGHLLLHILTYSEIRYLSSGTRFTSPALSTIDTWI